MSGSARIKKVEASHIWEREANEHYVEERWCDARLFEAEHFTGTTQDPCCGFGRIVEAGRAAGVPIFGTDLVDRGFAEMLDTGDFLKQRTSVRNIVSNPPFNIFPEIAHHALKVADHKVAMIWLVRRLAAATWLERTPLARIYYMNPRPSMPPGHVIAAGEKPGGGKQDFAWLIWDHAHKGPATTHWLRKKPVAAA